MLIKHKENCLSINAKQSVKLEEEIIKFEDHIPCSFAYKIVCIDDRFTKPIVVYRGENAAYEFTKAIFKEYKYCKKVINIHFNKNLIMNEEEHLFQKSNSCCICKKLLQSFNFLKTVI